MEMSDGAIRLLAGLLQARTGQQLAVGRRWRIEMALRPLMAERGVQSADALVARLAGGTDRPLTDRVLEALLNHETSFFRDYASFDLLAARAFGRLERLRANTRRLRIWCAGCSNGQEAYTLAMIFAEAAARWQGWRIEIVGTDVSALAVERAAEGVYSQAEVQRGLSVRRLMRFFEPQGDDWRAGPALRQMLRFRQHNILDRPPAGAPFDAILCRNVLLYFPAPTRRIAFARLGAAMDPDGALMLGAGETVLGQTDQFVSDYECRGLYRPIRPVPETLDRAAQGG